MGRLNSLMDYARQVQRQAVEIDPRRAGAVPSTKGTLGGSLS